MGAELLPVTSQKPYECGYTVQISDTESGFRHRIIRNFDNVKGLWAKYEQPATLDNYAHFTQFFEGEFTPETLLKLTSEEVEVNYQQVAKVLYDSVSNYVTYHKGLVSPEEVAELNLKIADTQLKTYAHLFKDSE